MCLFFLARECVFQSNPLPSLLTFLSSLLISCCPAPPQLLPLLRTLCDLERAFSALGILVFRLRWPALLAPSLTLAALAALGLPRLDMVSDVEELFAPGGSRAAADRHRVEAAFPGDRDHFVFGHQSREPPQVSVILLLEDPSDAFSEDAFRVLKGVETFLMEYDGNAECSVVAECPSSPDWKTYRHLCARKRSGECAEGFGEVESLQRLAPRIRAREVNLSFPVMKNEVARQTYYFPKIFGGAGVEDSFLTGAKALRLTFPLSEEDPLSGTYQLAAAKCLSDNAANFSRELPGSRLFSSSTRSVEVELGDNLASAADLVPASVCAVVAFCTAASLGSSAKSALLASLGLAATCASAAAAWGALALAGQPFQSINLAALFLLLGVGLDDTFVMISAWERAKKKSDSTGETLSLTFSDAGVSITVTSLTNVAAFAVGYLTSDFLSVRLFCLFTGAALAAVYVAALLVFGSLLAILDGWEFSRGGPQAQAWWFDSPTEDLFGVLTWIGRNIIKAFQSPLGKASVLTLFAAYLVVSGMSLQFVKEGLERQRLARDSSGLVGFFTLENRYFRRNPWRLQLVFPEELEYWNDTVRKEVESAVVKFKSSSFISADDGFTEDWLKEFKEYLEEETGESAVPEDKVDFMEALRDFLGVVSETPVAENVMEGEEGLRSRFVFQSSQIPDSASDKRMAAELRALADSSPLRPMVFHPNFPFFDQLLSVLPSTLASVFCSFAAVLAVAAAAFFLGSSSSSTNASSSLASVAVVACTILSVELGVCGLMAPLGVSLDVVSMIILVMCVGFSVDYSAHVATHFVRLGASDPDEALAECLSSYGPPVTKSALSTALGVSPLLFTESYILKSFAKLMLSVVAIGLLHGIVLLPVVLSLIRKK